MKSEKLVKAFRCLISTVVSPIIVVLAFVNVEALLAKFPIKPNLSPGCLTVQQISREWEIIVFIVGIVAALTLGLMIMVRKPRTCWISVLLFITVILMQVRFRPDLLKYLGKLARYYNIMITSAFLDLLIMLYLIGLRYIETPRNKSAGTFTPYEQTTKDEALSLYTFYEGRVQTTKSILVGILAGILSLQIPIFLQHILEESSFSWKHITPLIVMSTLSIPVFISMKIHMQSNDYKSKKFRDRVVEEKNINYNPEPPGWSHKFFSHFSLGLDSILLIAIILLPFISLFFINC